MQREPVASVASTIVCGLMALPPDWQPNETGAKLAVELLGDIGAANSLAKFRARFEDSGRVMRAGDWQGRFKTWVHNERNRPTSPQLPLPLMTALDGSKANAASEFVTIRQGTPEAATLLEARRGKPIPWGRSGTWAVKATEWPPQPEQRSESG